MAASSTATVQFLAESYQGKLKHSNNGVHLDVGNGRKLSSISSIAKHCQRTSDQFKGLSLEQRMAVEQWLEYKLYIDRAADNESEKLVLQELNRYLQDKVYFVGMRPTIADILIYHSIHAILSKLTFQEKEKFIHVSRWFNNIQQDQQTRQSLPVLPFLRTTVYDGASKH